jgi:hypothetical protein
MLGHNYKTSGSSLPPAGFSEWLTADTGLSLSLSKWTNQAAGADVWSVNGTGCTIAAINGKAALGLSSSSPSCTVTSIPTWDSATGGSTCWTLGAIYRYTGTLCGSSCPALDIMHSATIISDSLGAWAGVWVGNSGAGNGYQALWGGMQAYDSTRPFAQVTGATNSAGSPHYGVVSYCRNVLQSWLDGVASSTVSVSGPLDPSWTMNIGMNTNSAADFDGAIRTEILYPSQPSISALNAWLKLYGGF